MRMIELGVVLGVDAELAAVVVSGGAIAIALFQVICTPQEP